MNQIEKTEITVTQHLESIEDIFKCKKNIGSMSNRIEVNHSISNLRFTVSKTKSVNLIESWETIAAHFSSEGSYDETLLQLYKSVKSQLHKGHIICLLRQRLIEVFDDCLNNHKLVNKKIDIFAFENHPSKTEIANEMQKYEDEVYSSSDSTSYFWEQLNEAQFVRKIKEDKNASIELQLMMDCGRVGNKVIKIIESTIGILLEDPNGCYIVRKAAIEFDHIRQITISHVEKDILHFSGRDHSSRVVQILVTLDERLRSLCLRVFSQNWSFVLNRISSQYLLSTCLRFSGNKNKDFLSIGIVLRREPLLLFESKMHKRALVSYLELCQEEEAILFYRIFTLDKFFVKRMDDKYMVYIFSIFLARKLPGALEGFKKEIEGNMPALLETDHFRYLMFRIFNNNRFKDVREGIAEAVHTILEMVDMPTDSSSNPDGIMHLMYGKMIRVRPGQKKKRGNKEESSVDYHIPSKRHSSGCRSMLCLKSRDVIFLAHLLLHSSISFESKVMETILRLSSFIETLRSSKVAQVGVDGKGFKNRGNETMRSKRKGVKI